MKILITGAQGFLGRNMRAELSTHQDYEVLAYSHSLPEKTLEEYCAQADFVLHFAGVNRPKDKAEFIQGNTDFTQHLLTMLKKSGSKAPVLMSSSVQAALDNPYGQSKAEAEKLLKDYAAATGNQVYIYRLPNLFGKWGKPNYNSVVATFCYNITRNIPIEVSGRTRSLKLVYIDDAVAEFMAALQGSAHADLDGFYSVPSIHMTTLGEIADALYSFKESREGSLQVPDVGHPFLKKLYSTYLSYLPVDEFSYALDTHADDRGSFTEILRTAERGQFSVNIAHPGIVKGNHWHHTKNEKFLVVSGKGLIRFRRVDDPGCEIIEYHVSGEKLQVVDIPPGYTHSIANEGTEELVTFMWCNECFDPEHPDTYWMEV